MASSSGTAANLSCARCHTPQADLDEPLKRCAKCKVLQYCSRECQKLDWPRHKQQCRQGELDTSTGPRIRQTMRLNLGDFDLQSRGENPTGSRAATIYYLKTSTPHLHDISVSGPFYPLESIIPQVLNNFGEECAQGRESFMEIVGQQGLGLSCFEHLTSPIDNNPNKTRTIKLIRERNATMAGKLPGPAWYILETEMNLDPRIASRSQAADGPVPVKDMLVHKTFDTLEAASKEAKALATSCSSGRPGAGIFETPSEFGDGGYCATVMTREGNSQKVINFQVRYDSGQIVYPE